MQADSTPMERFLARVVKEGPLWDGSPCWIWTGALHRTGYGCFPRRGGEAGSRAAHRMAWILHEGAIPEGLVVRHRCRHRDCVNPAHLRLGTQAENMRDFREAGHASISPEPRSQPRPPRVWRICYWCGRFFLSPPGEKRWFCSRAHWRLSEEERSPAAYRHGRRPRPAADRFWAKVVKTDTCWLWIGARQGNGYGNFKGDGPQVGAHRFSWIFHYGPIPDGLYVLHNCPGGDRRECVNPEHLWLGTAGDNITDAVRKERVPMGDQHPSRLYPERRARGDQHWTHLYPERVARGESHVLFGKCCPHHHGERNGNSRWQPNQVREIRRRVQAGERQIEICREIGMSPSTMSAIVNRKLWPYLD